MIHTAEKILFGAHDKIWELNLREKRTFQMILKSKLITELLSESCLYGHSSAAFSNI